MTTENKERFEKAFQTFGLEFARLLRERVEELMRERIQVNTSPDYSRYANPYALRHKLYENLAKKIGEDYILCIKKIVIPACKQLTDEEAKRLKERLAKTFTAQLNDAKRAEEAIAGSTGRGSGIKDARSILESEFNNTLSKYSKRLESIIQQANLKAQYQNPDKPTLNDKQITHFDEIKIWAKNNPFLVIIMTLFIVIIALGNVTDSLDSIKKFWGSTDANTKVGFSESDYDVAVNPRFGFAYLYPKYWDRSDPANGDGNGYKDPKEDLVEVHVWGNYAVVNKTLDEMVQFTIENLQQEKGFRLLLDRESGKFAISWSDSSGKILESRHPIEGRRIVYEVFEPGEKITVMKASTQLNDKQFTMQCRAPSSLYKLYEDMFIKLTSSLKVIER